MDCDIKKYLIFLFIVFFGTYTCYTQTASAAYGFNKVRIELSLAHPVDTLKLNNPGKDLVDNLQITTRFWTQANGNDVYYPNQDLIVAPPIMKIQPGNTQIVRIGWRHPAPIK